MDDDHAAARVTGAGAGTDLPQSLPTPRAHLRTLDGLRGVAILAVLMIHCEQLIAGLSQPVRDLTFYGVRGVQLFFIVSGLTLTMNYSGRAFHAASFFARRFFRIAPMFYVGIALYLLLSRATTMPLPTASAGAIDVAATVLFLHGWLPSAINTVVPGGWSIAAEAMFYLAFPLLLAAARRPRTIAVVTLASYGVAALTYTFLRRTIGSTPEGANFALEFWLVHAPAFVGGCWLGTLGAPSERQRTAARIALPASMIGLAIDSQARGHSNLLVAIALLTLFAWSARVVRPRVLEGRWLPLIGQISFSLYILQFAVIGVLRPLAPAIEATVGPGLALAALYAAAGVTTGCLSYLTYRGIELPAMTRRRRPVFGRVTLSPSRQRCDEGG